MVEWPRHVACGQSCQKYLHSPGNYRKWFVVINGRGKQQSYCERRWNSDRHRKHTPTVPLHITTFALCWKGTQCIDLSYFPQVFSSFCMNSLTNHLHYLLLHLCHCHHHWQWSPVPVSISQSPPPPPLSSSPEISFSPHPHTPLTVTGGDSSTPTRDERIIIIKEGGTVICVHNIRSSITDFDNVEIIHVKKG